MALSISSGMIFPIPACIGIERVVYIGLMYLLHACRAGSLNVAKCEELRVRPGKNYARLKLGESVLNEDGIEVLPEQVGTPLPLLHSSTKSVFPLRG